MTSETKSFVDSILSMLVLSLLTNVGFALITSSHGESGKRTAELVMEQGVK